MALPLKNVEYIFSLGLTNVLDPDEFVIDPTIAAGDFKVSTDGGVFLNLVTLPEVEPTGSAAVKVTVSADEMNGEKVNIQAIDAAGSEWQDVFVAIDIPTGNTESLTEIEIGDRIETNNRLIINKAGTTTPVLDKKITGSLLTPNVTIRTTDTP